MSADEMTTKLEDRLRDRRHCNDWYLRQEAAEEIDKLMTFVGFVGSWVSKSTTSYSIHALDGLMGMTRDRIGEIYKRRAE